MVALGEKCIGFGTWQSFKHGNHLNIIQNSCILGFMWSWNYRYNMFVTWQWFQYLSVMTFKSLWLLLLQMESQNVFLTWLYLSPLFFWGIVFLFSSLFLLHHDLVFLGFCLGCLLLAMFCLAPGRFYSSPRRSGILVTFHLLNKLSLVTSQGLGQVAMGYTCILKV